MQIHLYYKLRINEWFFSSEKDLKIVLNVLNKSVVN